MISTISRRKLKKAPMPFLGVFPPDNSAESEKIIKIIRSKFDKMFDGKTNLNTSQMKRWGEFLFQRQIYWERMVPKNVDWEGWETYTKIRGAKRTLMVRPKGVENHLKIGSYYVPKDLAFKMLVLGELV